MLPGGVLFAHRRPAGAPLRGFRSSLPRPERRIHACQSATCPPATRCRRGFPQLRSGRPCNRGQEPEVNAPSADAPRFDDGDSVTKMQERRRNTISSRQSFVSLPLMHRTNGRPSRPPRFGDHGARLSGSTRSTSRRNDSGSNGWGCSSPPVKFVPGQRQERPGSERTVDLSIRADQQLLVWPRNDREFRGWSRCSATGQPAVEPLIDGGAEGRAKAVAQGGLRPFDPIPAPAIS